jgi:hypothetical protein
MNISTRTYVARRGPDLSFGPVQKLGQVKTAGLLRAGVWNRVPDAVRGQVIDLALERPELSPRELAVTFTDEKAQFISEASVYRLLRANGLLTSPAFIVMEAAEEFKDKTTAPNRIWRLVKWSPIGACQFGLAPSTLRTAAAS